MYVVPDRLAFGIMGARLGLGAAVVALAGCSSSHATPLAPVPLAIGGLAVELSATNSLIGTVKLTTNRPALVSVHLVNRATSRNTVDIPPELVASTSHALT